MRPRLWALACLVAVATALGCGGAPVSTGGWVVRHELAEPGGAKRVCAVAGAAGLDQVLVQVRGRGDAYYRSERVPLAESLTGAEDGETPRDPLAEVLAACHDREVVAWLNVYFLWEGDIRPAAPGHVANAHPEWLLRDADGRSVAEYGPLERAAGWIEGLYADPAAAGYREHFVEVVREVVTRYPVAGVHLDFVRYPGPDYGQGGDLGASFAAAWGVDPRLLPAELRTPELGPWLAGEGSPADRVLITAALLWAEMRSARVTALVRAVRAVLDVEAPQMGLSAAVFPDPGNAYLAKGQDWPAWAAAGLVDALYPMAYFGGPERVAGQLQEVAGLVPADTEVWAGLGAYIKEPGPLADEAATARRLGYDGVCLFDVGTVLDTAAGLEGYVQAVSGPRGRRGPRSAMAAPMTHTRGGAWLGAIAARAAGGGLPLATEVGAALDARWAEFEAARGALTAALHSGGEGVRLLPAALDLVGVFRYVHPGDGPERRAAQRQRAEEARGRLLAGEDPGAVAAELSQGGTRKLGGVLPPRILWPGAPLTEPLRGLETGHVSAVVPVANGFWVYRVTRREPPRPVAVAEAPWEAQRQWFRQALGAALERGTTEATVQTTSRAVFGQD